jgi:hypothetical protein
MISQLQIEIIRDINKIIVENRDFLTSKEIIQIMEHLVEVYKSELEVFGEVK